MVSITRKGGMAITVVAGIVIVLVATVTFLYILGIFGSSAQAGVTKDICKKSVFANHLGEIKGMRFAELDINCPTVDVSIKKGSEDAEANKVLADSLFHCWDQFHQGKLGIFNEDGVYCAICHRITFEDGFEKKNPEITGLFEHLASYNAPSGGMTYLSFLQGFQTENSEWLLSKLGDNDAILASDQYSLDPRREYATIFVYVKGKDRMRIALDFAQNSINSDGAGLFLFSGLVVLGGVATAASGGVLLPIIGGAMIAKGGALLWGSGAYVGAQATIETDMDYDHMAYVALREFDEEELNKLKCEVLVGK